jgi:hypothetical protein
LLLLTGAPAPVAERLTESANVKEVVRGLLTISKQRIAALSSRPTPTFTSNTRNPKNPCLGTLNAEILDFALLKRQLKRLRSRSGSFCNLCGCFNAFYF